MCLKFSSNIYHSNTGYYESKYSAGTTNESSKNKVKVRINKKILEYIVKIALFPISFREERTKRADDERAWTSGTAFIERAVERFAVTRVTQSPAGLAPISRITRIRPAKMEGETSEKEPRTRFCVSLTTELRNACVTLSDRVSPGYLSFFPAIIFPILGNMRFSIFLFLPSKSICHCFSIERIEDQMLSMLDKLFEKGRKFEVRIHERGNLWNWEENVRGFFRKFRIKE